MISGSSRGAAQKVAAQTKKPPEGDQLDRVLDNADHYTQFDRPDAVVTAIREVVHRFVPTYRLKRRFVVLLAGEYFVEIIADIVASLPTLERGILCRSCPREPASNATIAFEGN